MLAFCPRFLTVPALALALVGTAASCSGGSRPDLERASGVDSVATVVVGDVTYELRVACYEADANLVAVGVGRDPVSDDAIKGLVRGPGDAYVGLMFGDDEYIYEADATVELVIERDGNRLAADGISFVRDTDLDSAEGSALGRGSVRVECRSTRSGTPDSPLATR